MQKEYNHVAASSASDSFNMEYPQKGKANIPSKNPPQRAEGANKEYHKMTPPTAQPEKVSAQTLSIQNLEFPQAQQMDNKANFKGVQRQTKLCHCSKAQSASITKDGGKDFTSSSSSSFYKTNRKLLAPWKDPMTKDMEGDSKSSPLLSFSSSSLLDPWIASQDMLDSHHQVSEKPLQLKGPEWHKPCQESFVAGAPRKRIGLCPPSIEKIAKMSRTRQKFFLTQDPRKVHCLVNPERLRSKQYSKEKDFNTLAEMVKHGQNTCATAATASESSESFICEVIDLENPLQLDFQGLDYKNTYQKDEQDLLNQRNFRKVQRFMERKRVKAETKVKVEEELRQERLQVPKCFEVRDRNTPRPPSPPAEPPKFGQLFRTADKPLNRQKLEKEKQQRRERYKTLYLENKARQEQQEQAAKQQLTEEEKNRGLISADKNFKNIVASINGLIGKSFSKEKLLRQTSIQQRLFSRTKRETKRNQRGLKPRNRQHRDGVHVNQNFYAEQDGEHKLCPKAELEFGSETPDHSSDTSKLNEPLSVVKDNLKLGQAGSKFNLRGFKLKLGHNLRGKITQKTKDKEKGCLTRDQWLRNLAPKRDKVKLDVEMGIQKLLSPDDPKLQLFNTNIAFKRTHMNELSAVRQFRLKALGCHYDRVLRKRLKIAQPRLRYVVKKFNLIGYRFGDITKRLAPKKHLSAKQEMEPFQLNTTAEYIGAKALKEQLQRQKIKQKRLELLGIPCSLFKKTRLQKKCENSSPSSDSEWVPERGPDLNPDDNEEIQILPLALREILPLSRRTNMPAPKYREPTLHQHPWRGRDYKSQRVPSEIFDEVVQTTAVPHLYKLPPDMIDYSNVALEKRPYMQMLEARHHHDHWNPIQQNYADVHYQPLVVNPEVTKVKRPPDQETKEHFQKAKPPGHQFVDMNLTLPTWDIDEIIQDYRETSKQEDREDITMGTIKIENLCHQKDLIVSSRDPEELKLLDYPGRQEYLKLLSDVKGALKESKQSENPQSKNLYVDKTTLLKDLEEDLSSIESCLTSLSSSEATNLSNDSGSFLLMEGKEKIPLDFIRKSLVPFEELQRSRFRVEPIDVDQEDNNPFRVLPFSGQRKTQLELSMPNDKFFTFNTRLKNGLRLRLEVPVQNKQGTLIGKGNHKYKGMVATDIDENYVNELKNRPSIKTFHFKMGSGLIKDALRLKFESLLIQNEMVRTKMYDSFNEQHWLNMHRLKMLFEELFAKWEKTEYEASMAVVYKVKAFYEETDRLKNQLKFLEREQVKLNMDIVFIEAHWIRCIMLQNFHYLLGDHEWRLEHDWIHRLPCKEEDANDHLNPGSQLESFEDSITKRSRVNVREREKDDAWAIRAFYEEVYLPNKHANLIVFSDARSFLQGLDNLKAKTFVLLLEMHFTLAIHTEFQEKLETFVAWCAKDLEEKQEYVARKCSKLYFMQDRAEWLRQRTMVYLDRPIEESFNDRMFLKDRAVITEAWRRIVPATVRGASAQLQPVDMIAMISDVVIELIAKFETIPMEETSVVERKLRARRNYLRKQSNHAYHMERRIEQEMKKVIRNLEPPCRKPKASRKLIRYHIKKPCKPVEIQEKKISDRAKFFFEAFNEGSADEMKTSELRDSIAQVDTIQEQIVPFYFDHFLKLNGYTPNYNFKTHVEMRDGPELERMQVRSVIPEIQERLLQWEAMKKKIMEDHIAQNPKMYINVV